MDLETAVLRMIDALEAECIPYMLVGSFSSNFYGIPRSTEDGDFVIELAQRSLSALIGRLGGDFDFDPQWAFESVTGTQRRIVKIKGKPLKIELFKLSDLPHDQERFRRRILVRWQGRNVSLPTAEDVIVTKANWALCLHRGKDRDDIQAVIGVQAGNLDWDYIYHWADQHGTRALLDEIRASVPPE